MTTDLNLEAYFERIDYRGDRRTTLETLGAIAEAHAQSIPFENLDPMLGRGVRLDLPSLEQKLIRERRGGYCYEHNSLLKHALQALGFSVSGLAARVLWNMAEDAVTPRSHMLLRVEVSGQSHVVDVGFGGNTLTGVLALAPNVEQSTPHEPFRLVPLSDAAGGFRMEAKLGQAWKPLYRFDLLPAFHADYEVSSWYLSNNPTSHFVTGLVAARPVPGKRYALRRNELAIHHAHGTSERRVLATTAELREVLEGPFGIHLPNDPNLEAALERMTRSA